MQKFWRNWRNRGCSADIWITITNLPNFVNSRCKLPRKQVEWSICQSMTIDKFNGMLITLLIMQANKDDFVDTLAILPPNTTSCSLTSIMHIYNFQSFRYFHVCVGLSKTFCCFFYYSFFPFFFFLFCFEQAFGCFSVIQWG